MATITIRNLDEETKRQLRIRAAENGRSMEEEARAALRAAIHQPAKGESLWQAIRSIVDPLGGVEFELPTRGPRREPPRFDE